MIPQRSEEWHKQRSKRVTGSIAGALLGLDPNTSKSKAIQILQGTYKTPDNIALSHGRTFESYALEDFKLETGLEVQECGFIPFGDWLGASPDGLIGEDAVLEIKCPMSKKPLESIKFKHHYYAQVQIEMVCAEREIAHFYQWSNDGKETMHEKVYFDRVFLGEYLPKLREIWEQTILSPNKTLEDMLKQYDEVCDQLKKLEENKSSLLNDIVKECGEKETVVNGRRIYQVTRKGNIDYQSLIAEHLHDVNVEEYRKPSGNPYWTIK